MKKFILLTLKFYKKCISPLLPPACRFYPTCSEYAFTAVSNHGALKGVFLATKRICKCHPFHPGGIDYVPEEFHFFRKKKDKE